MGYSLRHPGPRRRDIPHKNSISPESWEKHRAREPRNLTPRVGPRVCPRVGPRKCPRECPRGCPRECPRTFVSLSTEVPTISQRFYSRGSLNPLLGVFWPHLPCEIAEANFRRFQLFSPDFSLTFQSISIDFNQFQSASINFLINFNQFQSV